MTVELNIFNINNQPLEYDEAHLVCLIEEITDKSDLGLKGPDIECFTQEEDDLDFDRLIGQNEILYEPSLEDPEVECFALCKGDIDFYRLLEPARIVVEPSMEDVELESFAQLGDDEYFDEVVELLKAIFDPISKMQPECGND
jgi:hypothetical protein